MIAEILLLLLGHKSSLFPSDHTIDPAFVPLLHPGEQQCLESLGLTAWQYRKVKAACARLVQTRSRYISALCSTLNTILADDYEALVVSIESQILHKDTNFVGIGSFVPLSSLRATFADWDAPFAALVHLMDVLEAKQEWQPGPLIDLLLERARSGVHKVSRILTQLSNAVQRVWMAQLSAFLLHSGSSLADGRYRLKEGVLPRVVTAQSRDSIAYVGRAIGTVRDAEKNQQLPRALVAQYVKLLDGVLPEDQHGFDQVIAEIRESVGEWLWTNVLTRQSVEQAVDTL
jgi:gamma-tubulin complex component 4